MLIDNYDSFTHILHHYLLRTGAECTVYRNDEITVSQLQEMHPSRLILSPGPGRPEGAGIMMDAIEHFYDKIPILGICLGHQALGIHYGCELHYAPEPVHGKQCWIKHDGSYLYEGIENPTRVMRYHSLSISVSVESDLTVTAATDDGVVMSMSHKKYPSIGIQFHPESVGTTAGQWMIDNWSRYFDL